VGIIDAEIAYPANHHLEWKVGLNQNKCLLDKVFYGVFTNNAKTVAGLLNSSVIWLFDEFYGYALGGGVAFITVNDLVKNVLICKPSLIPPSQRARLISAFERLAQREVRSIFEELGFAICRERGCQNPEHPYEFVNPKALTLEQVRKASPDRFELDSVVFDILGLTDEERLEVYKAVADLVKSRLTKARSV
jgi:hypothetical protein